MLQADDRISIIRLDEVVKNALEYYVEYMDRILQAEALSKTDPRIHANAKRSRDTARRFLDDCVEKRTISVADGAGDIKQYIIMLELYGDYIGSIDNSMEPSLSERRIVDQRMKDEYGLAVKKMYEFYSLLTRIKYDEIYPPEEVKAPHLPAVNTPQTDDLISIIRLDETAKNALEYYAEYMDRILRDRALSEAGSQVCASAKKAGDTAKRFLGHCEEGRLISIADGEGDIKQYIAMLSIYSDYLSSINDAAIPSLKRHRIFDEGIRDEHDRAVQKMYDFYSLLTRMERYRI